MNYYLFKKRVSNQLSQISFLNFTFNFSIFFFAGSWFKGDLKEIIDDALAAGIGPAISNSLTINGQPGDLYPCSAGKPCMP